MNAALLLDVENIYKSVGKRFQRRLDYSKYIDFLETKFGLPLAIRIAYGSQKPKDARGFINLLKALGFTAKFEEGTDWNVPIALAAMNLAQPGNVVVLGSNHKNLGPVIETLQAKGVRTFVCGCSIHPNLKTLSEYFEIDESLLLPIPVESEELSEAPATVE